MKKKRIKDFIKKLVKIKKIVLRQSDIIVNGYFTLVDGKVQNENFGDDINIPLLQSLTGRDVIVCNPWHHKNKERILCVGSIIENYQDENNIIWGSGAIYGDRKVTLQPKKVYAVRGPLTRQNLIEQDIACPEIYGDPALLLPYVYNPNVKKKYKYGFIPHYIDYNLPHVKAFRDSHPEILFIKFQGYESWQDVIKQINSCEKIVSSSLHGMIVSDAYGIPNVQVILSDNITGGVYKYMDYCAGVNRDFVDPVDCREFIQWDLIERNFENYTRIEYNPTKLLCAFPYKLTKRFRKLIN